MKHEDNYNIETIIRYCSGIISDNEKKAFKLKIEKDHDFRQIVNNIKDYILIEKKNDNDLNLKEKLEFEDKLQNDSIFVEKYNKEKMMIEFLKEDKDDEILRLSVSKLVHNFFEKQEDADQKMFRAGERSIDSLYTPSKIADIYRKYRKLEEKVPEFIKKEVNRGGNSSTEEAKLSLVEPINNVDCSDYLKVKFNKKVSEPIIIRIRNNRNKIIFEKKVTDSKTEYILDISMLESGQHYFQFCYPSTYREINSRTQNYASDATRGEITVSFTKDKNLLLP